MVYRGAAARHPAPPAVYGAESLAAGLPVLRRLQQHLPQKPETLCDDTRDAGAVRASCRKERPVPNAGWRAGQAALGYEYSGRSKTLPRQIAQLRPLEVPIPAKVVYMGRAKVLRWGRYRSRCRLPVPRRAP